MSFVECLSLGSAPIFGVGNEEVSKGALFDYVLPDFHPLLRKCLSTPHQNTISVQARLNKSANITVEIHFQKNGDKYLCRFRYPGSDGGLEGSLVNFVRGDAGEHTRFVNGLEWF